MAIDKLPSGRYRVRIYRKGRVVNTQTFQRKRDAETFERNQRTALASGTWSAPVDDAVTVRELGEVWLAGSSVSDRTRQDYQRLLDKNINPAFGNRALATLQPSEIRAWATALYRRSQHQARQSLVVLRQVVKVALVDGLIGRSPVEGVRLPTPRRAEPEPLTRDQLAALVEVIENPRDRLMVQVMGYGGLRFGEVSALRVRDVQGDHLHLRRSVQPAQGGGWLWGDLKNHQSRRVPLPRFLVTALHAYAEGMTSEQLLFTSRGGSPVDGGNWSSRVLTPACAAAGVPRVTPHALRDTAATLAIGMGAPVTAVARLLGHGDASVVLKHYAGVFDDDLTAIARRFEVDHD